MINSAVIISYVWYHRLQRRFKKLKAAMRGAFARAKALKPPIWIALIGPPLFECFGADVGKMVQERAAKDIIRPAVRAYRAELEKRRRLGSKINLTIVNMAGDELFFKLRMRTRLDKLLKAYCTRQGVAQNSVRFLFDGNRVSASQTPEELEMEDGDIIDVMVEQQGD